MTFDPSELERLDAERPKPPSLLYKYVIPDRVDVLTRASIRFTPPLNTNDIFEVRQTFDLLAGPKMQTYFREISMEIDFDETFRRALDESPLSFLSVDQAKSLILRLGGCNVEDVTRGLLNQFIDRMPEQLNTPENIDSLLERIASKRLLLSLSERLDSSPMWAHYAANSAGFVIAFDTSSEFFRRGAGGELQGLHKIHYFDGRIGEMIADPFVALNSKQLDWAYEREWRLYVDPDQVTDVRQIKGDKIHLVQFPRKAVKRVIAGLRSSQSLKNHLRRVLDRDYPEVSLTQLTADRSTASLVEIE